MTNTPVILSDAKGLLEHERSLRSLRSLRLT